MRRTFLLFILLSSAYLIFSQNLSYPEGCYMSYDEIILKTPSQNFNVSIEKRTESDIKMVGGNDYKLISSDEKFKKKILKKEIWAYSDGNDLFLNCIHFYLQPWYTKVISDGKYIVFMAAIPTNQAMQSKEMQVGMAFGAVGGAIAGASLALKRFLYVLEKESKIVIYIDSESIKPILSENKNLLNEYLNEKSSTWTDTQIKYLKLLNQNYY